MKIIARPISFCSSISRSMIWARIETSRAETASSQITSFGFRIMARAMPTLWFWPPDSSCG